MVFVGYEPGSKAYRVYDPLSGRLHITRDVVFDESKGWNWSSTAEPTADDTVEYPVTAVSVAGEPAMTPSPTPSPAPTPAAKGAGHTCCDHTRGAGPAGGLRLSANPHPIWDRSGHVGAPRRYRRVTDCINTSEPRELDPGELLLAATEEPTTFEQANADPAWRAAMQEELSSIIDNGT